MSVVGAVAWYAFLLCIVLTYQRLTRCLTTLNLFTLFLIFFLMRHGITVPFDVAVSERVTGVPLHPGTLGKVQVALVLMYVGMLLGTWVTRDLLRTPAYDSKHRGARQRVEDLPAGVHLPLFWMSVVIVIGLVVLAWVRVPPREVLVLWREGLSAEQYKSWREAYGSATNYAGSSLAYAGSLARWAFLPTISYMLYCLRSRGRSYRIGFFITFGLALIVGLVSGQKSPALFLVTGLLVTRWVASGRVAIRPWDLRLVASAVALFFLVLPMLYALQYPFLDYFARLKVGAFRLTSEADRVLQLYFDFYPATFPHLSGASSFVLNKLLMLGYVSLPPEQRIPVAMVGPEYHNTWNAAFIATAWADFGWWGIVLESFFVGWLLQMIHHWFVTSRKSAAMVGAYAGLIMAATRLSEVPLFTSLFSYGLGSSLILFLLIKEPQPKASSVVEARPASVVSETLSQSPWPGGSC